MEEKIKKEMLLPIKDALEVLEGKWKFQVIMSLALGRIRFKEIAKDIGGISDRMLSKELKELEMHKLVKRTVVDSFPPVVEYELTEHGKTLRPLIDEIREWGRLHRNTVISDHFSKKMME